MTPFLGEKKKNIEFQLKYGFDLSISSEAETMVPFGYDDLNMLM